MKTVIVNNSILHVTTNRITTFTSHHMLWNTQKNITYTDGNSDTGLGQNKRVAALNIEMVTQHSPFNVKISKKQY